MINLSFSNFEKSFSLISFGGSLRKCIFKTEIIILWKSDNPVSIIHVLWKDRDLFIKIKSMQLGFSGHVDCLMRPFKQRESQKIFIASSSTYARKSPRRKMFSNFVEKVSNVLVIVSRSFIMLLLWGLFEELITVAVFYKE